MNDFDAEAFIDDVRCNVLLSADVDTYRKGDTVCAHTVSGKCAVHGDYELYREVDGELYQEITEVIIEAGDGVPRLFLPSLTVSSQILGFCHFYGDGHCCLCPEHAAMKIWESVTDAKSFFEELVDPFLVNMYSMRRNGYAAVGYLLHGEDGIKEYYSDLLGITASEFSSMLPGLRGIIKSNNRNLMTPCPCGSGLRLRSCRCPVSGFIKDTFNDRRMLDAVRKDLDIKEPGRGRRRATAVPGRNNRRW